MDEETVNSMLDELRAQMTIFINQIDDSISDHVLSYDKQSKDYNKHMAIYKKACDSKYSTTNDKNIALVQSASESGMMADRAARIEILYYIQALGLLVNSLGIIFKVSHDQSEASTQTSTEKTETYQDFKKELDQLKKTSNKLKKTLREQQPYIDALKEGITRTRRFLDEHR